MRLHFGNIIMSKPTTAPRKPRARTARAEDSSAVVATELATTETSATARPKGKIGALISLLERPSGATIDAMMDATGWQKHSVRGAIAGAIKKDRGLAVTSEKTADGRIYRITPEV
jgi:hypothetical protein